MEDEKWEVITSLVHCLMCNTDGIEWGLNFYKYADTKRDSITGGEIGHMDSDGCIVVNYPKKHRVIFAKPSYKGTYMKDKGVMIWLENKNYEEE